MELEDKIYKSVDLSIKHSVINRFEEIATEIKQLIIAEYDDKFTAIVTSSKSKINYNMYRTEFISRLEDMEFIYDEGKRITLSVPEMELFDFSDGLEIVKTMLEGTSGIYVEVDEKEYATILGRKPNLSKAIDRRMPPKERVFLLRYTGNVKRAEKELNKRFNKFAFSNTPPIDILSTCNEFVEDNINKWIDEAIKSNGKEIINKYK